MVTGECKEKQIETKPLTKISREFTVSGLQKKKKREFHNGEPKKVIVHDELLLKNRKNFFNIRNQNNQSNTEIQNGSYTLICRELRRENVQRKSKQTFWSIPNTNNTPHMLPHNLNYGQGTVFL
jgi:hypothetical protein